MKSTFSTLFVFTTIAALVSIAAGQGHMRKPLPITGDREISIYQDDVDVCGVSQKEAMAIYTYGRQNPKSVFRGQKFEAEFQITNSFGAGPLSVFIDLSGSGGSFDLKANVTKNIDGTDGVLLKLSKSEKLPVIRNFTFEIPQNIQCYGNDQLCLLIVVNGQGVGSCIFVKVEEYDPYSQFYQQSYGSQNGMTPYGSQNGMTPYGNSYPQSYGYQSPAQYSYQNANQYDYGYQSPAQYNSMPQYQNSPQYSNKRQAAPKNTKNKKKSNSNSNRKKQASYYSQPSDNYGYDSNSNYDQQSQYISPQSKNSNNQYYDYPSAGNKDYNSYSSNNYGNAQQNPYYY